MMDHDLKPCLAVDTFRQASADTSGKTGWGFFSCLAVDTFRPGSKEVLTPQGKQREGDFFSSIPSGKKVMTPQGKQRCGEVVRFFFMLGCRYLQASKY